MEVSGSDIPADIASRLRAFRFKTGKAQDAFALETGIAYGTYKRLEAGDKPKSESLEKLMMAGLNINWLLSGEGEMLLARPLDEAHARAIDMFFGDAEPHFVREPEQQSYSLSQVTPIPPVAPHGFILVPRYDVSASMGNGAVIHSEQIVDHLAFREQWVRTELNTSPKNLVLISAIGDSMEPTLRAGDLLLIDRGGEGVKQDAIYVFAMHGELRVKRMQLKLDGSVMVRSDNPQYEAERLSANQIGTLNIVGRVVWSGRRM